MALTEMVRRARGLLGVGVFGGIAGALWGVGVMMLNSLGVFGPSVVFGLAWSTMGWGAFGALVGVAFGAVTMVTSGGRSVSALGFWRSALLGGAIGVGVPALIGTTLTWVFPPFVAAIPLTMMCGLFGMLFGSGLVAVGKEAEMRDRLEQEGARARIGA